ncbi:MAG TPA: UDP-N-acetylmuramoyl-L-alanine--D-glutamate ligase [Abditibacterium sp.]|jgi:UDP-N-acetylmuramoylalanine--D-glutamate ligase
MNEFQGKTAAVIGLARAGIPAAKFLIERGAKVVGYDGKTRENLAPDALELENLGAQLQLGEHDFAGIESCDLIVLSPGLKVHFEPLKSVIEAAEARGSEVIGELELASRFCPCPIIGVTGTKGKSTTTKLITEMLQACGVDAISAGNTGTPLISVLPQLKPESWAVVEVSSFQLEKAPTFRPKIAVLLSLLEDHQDYHPTLEQYWETKLKIFDNQTADDFCVLNSDDERVVSCEGYPWESVRVRSSTFPEYGHTGIVDGKLGIYLNSETDEFLGVLAESEVPLSGKHNLANAAVALAVVSVILKLEVEAQTDEWMLKFEQQAQKHLREMSPLLSNAIRDFQSLPHRLEIVAQKDGITWINDSQSTIPDASIAALKSFPSPVTLLIGGRAKIEAAGYENLMREVKEHKARLILFGEAKEMLYEVALSLNMEKTYIFRENTLAEAMRIAKIQSLQGESVILSPACASFDQFTSYEHRGETFRQLAREI